MLDFIYPFLISFIMVFIAELGDKTQLLVLSFSGGVRVRNIILGIAIGSFFSHGIAILFGSKIGVLENENLHSVIKFITYFSFIVVGILSLIPKKEKINSSSDKKGSLLEKISKLNIGYTFIIALSILVGEFGDKTFLASLGFGIQYPSYKFMLIVGAILGMIASDSIAIISGKFIRKYISEEAMKKLSRYIVFDIWNTRFYFLVLQLFYFLTLFCCVQKLYILTTFLVFY